MIPVYQTIVDKGNGNCMQAAIASLLELPLDKVPHFLEIEIETKVSAWHHMGQWLLDNGYEYKGTLYNFPGCHEKYLNDPHIRSILRFKDDPELEGIDGFFFASVISPKYYDKDKPSYSQTTHAVIIDKDCNIVHDPNPGNKGVTQYPLNEEVGFNGVIHIALIERKK